MRIVISRDALVRASQAAAKAASRADTRERACALVEAGDGAASFSATDGDRSVKVAAQALVEEPGRALVSALALSKIAKSLPDAAVTIECAGRSCLVSCGKARFEVPALDPAGWQGPEAGAAGPPVKVGAAELKALCERVAPFAAKNDAIMALNGVHLTASGGRLTAEACDRYVFARAHVECAGGAEVDFVAPAEFLLSAASLAEGDVELSGDGRRLRVSCEGSESSARAVEGKYPGLDGFFGGPYAYDLELSPVELAASMRRASLVDGVCKCRLDASGGRMAVSAAGAGGASFADEAWCEGEASFCGNPGLIEACARAMDSDRVSARSAGPAAPLVFVGESVSAGVMPMAG